MSVCMASKSAETVQRNYLHWQNVSLNVFSKWNPAMYNAWEYVVTSCLLTAIRSPLICSDCCVWVVGQLANVNLTEQMVCAVALLLITLVAQCKALIRACQQKANFIQCHCTRDNKSTASHYGAL